MPRGKGQRSMWNVGREGTEDYVECRQGRDRGLCGM